MAAIAFQEPGFEEVVDRLIGHSVNAPLLLKFELANVAWKKARRHPAAASGIFAALSLALDDRHGLVWHDVDAAGVALVAHATGLTAYDASYLWLAGLLGADLVTLDTRIAAASRASL
jgi:predicted nucleic acid-binding protein